MSISNTTRHTHTSDALFNLCAIVVAAGIGMLTAGCANSPELDFSDSGSTQVLERGSTFDVKLENNASTGYSWQTSLSDPQVVQLVDTAYESYSEADGAGGNAIFTFECRSEGTARIEMEHVPPGGGGGETGNQTFVLDVIVQ